MGELMLATVRAVGDGVHGYVNGGWRVSYAVVCRFRYFSMSTLFKRQFPISAELASYCTYLFHSLRPKTRCPSNFINLSPLL